MPIAITDDHRALAETAADFLARRDARRATRDLLEADAGGLPGFWDELATMGWLGLHVPEEHGGSGYTLEELVVVVEELGRAIAPGPFVPTVIASAVLAAAGDDAAAKTWLPGLADGSVTAGIALTASVTTDGTTVSGSAPLVLGGELATLLVVPAGDDVALVEIGAGVTVTTPRNLDPGRRSSKVTFEGAAATILPGAARLLTDLGRVILAAEAVGVARDCTDAAAAYAKERLQFGRVIGTYQAVKHHCANMAVATELATSAVWDAARAAATGGDQLAYAAAVAATLAAPAADLCAQLNIQVHGGIGFTWEHDAHLYLRRATTLLAYLEPSAAAADVVDLARSGVRRAKPLHPPPQAGETSTRAPAFAAPVPDL
jgi:hypothetical protein